MTKSRRFRLRKRPAALLDGIVATTPTVTWNDLNELEQTALKRMNCGHLSRPHGGGRRPVGKSRLSGHKARWDRYQPARPRTCHQHSASGSAGRGRPRLTPIRQAAPTDSFLEPCSACSLPAASEFPSGRKRGMMRPARVRMQGLCTRLFNIRARSVQNFCAYEAFNSVCLRFSRRAGWHRTDLSHARRHPSRNHRVRISTMLHA